MIALLFSSKLVSFCVLCEWFAEKLNSESVNSLPKSLKSPLLLLAKLPENEFILVLPTLLANDSVAELVHSLAYVSVNKKKIMM